MEQISIFNWLLLNCLPAWAVVPIIQVKDRFSNQIITKEVIIIISINLDWWSSRKINNEIVTLVESRLSCVKLVILLLIDNILTTLNVQVWVRKREGISLRKIEAFDHIESDFALGNFVQHGSQLLLEYEVIQFLENFQLCKSSLVYVFLELLHGLIKIVKIINFVDVEVFKVEIEFLRIALDLVYQFDKPLDLINRTCDLLLRLFL